MARSDGTWNSVIACDQVNGSVNFQHPDAKNAAQNVLPGGQIHHSGIADIPCGSTFGHICYFIPIR
jgi:hypothetical protein